MTIMFKRTKPLIRTPTPNPPQGRSPAARTSLHTDSQEAIKKRGSQEVCHLPRCSYQKMHSRTLHSCSCPGGSVGGRCVNVGAHVAPISLLVPGKMESFRCPVSTPSLALKPFWRFWSLSVETRAASCHS